MKTSTGLWLLRDYARTLPLFIILFYFVTANPDGSFHLTWNLANGYLTLTYLAAYPLLMHWFPKWRRNHFKSQSLATKSSRLELEDNHNNELNPIKNKYDLNFQNERRDDLINISLRLFAHGLLMIFALPIVLGVGLYRVIKTSLHH